MKNINVYCIPPNHPGFPLIITDSSRSNLLIQGEFWPLCDNFNLVTNIVWNLCNSSLKVGKIKGNCVFFKEINLSGWEVWYCVDYNQKEVFYQARNHYHD